MRLVRAGFLSVGITNLLLIAGCGGGNSSPPANNSGVTSGASTISSVAIACSPSSVQVNQTSNCSATVTGTGNYSSVITWSVDNGTIDQSGKYTAPATPTTANIKAVSNQDSTKSGTTQVTVSAPPPSITSVSVVCSPSSIPIDQTAQCTANLAGTGNFNPAVIWSVDTGTINKSGQYIASNTPTTANITATSVQDSSKTGTATVVVVPGITLASLTVKPDNIFSGTTSTAMVVSSSPAPVGGVLVYVSSNNVAALVPQSVAIAAGSNSTSFSITAGMVTTPTTTTISATSASIQTSTLIVNPTATANWSGGPQPSMQVSGQCVTGDFNGYGKTDLACYTGVNGTWDVALSNGGGWQLQSWNNGIPVSEIDSCFTGDFNGDGLTDLVCPGAGGAWSVALSMGTGWNLQNWTGLSGSRCHAGDFNGDGKTDLACWGGSCAQANSPCSGDWNVGLSTGMGWQVQAWNGGPAPVEGSAWICYMGDFTGDGKSDIACNGSLASGTWDMGLSTGDGWDHELWAGGPNSTFYFPPYVNCFPGKFNDDGMTDFACWTNTPGNWEMGLSLGNGWNDQIWSAGPGVANPASNQCFSGDFNGDGLTDLACYSGVGTAWGVGLSTGSGWTASLWNGGPTPTGPQPSIADCITGDFNGDGKLDVSCYTGSGGVWAVALSTGSGW